MEHKRKTKRKMATFKGRIKEVEEEHAQAGTVIRDLKRENRRLKREIEILQKSKEVEWRGAGISPRGDGIFLSAEAAMALLRERSSLLRS